SVEALEEARGIAAWSRESAEAWRAALGADVHGRLVRALAGVTVRYERAKAEKGVLDFLDLLLKARDALRDRPAVREHFRRRFRHLIIDEFQDTDPLQVETAWNFPLSSINLWSCRKTSC
ncbi:MAG: UvrD-helicase domain-containing protein, partial [Deltaproteobacteria bacterium]|nr:UvrD-helicase domain-containing protein [Deltaproteobacteria bacterium]